MANGKTTAKASGGFAPNQAQPPFKNPGAKPPPMTKGSQKYGRGPKIMSDLVYRPSGPNKTPAAKISGLVVNPKPGDKRVPTLTPPAKRASTSTAKAKGK